MHQELHPPGLILPLLLSLSAPAALAQSEDGDPETLVLESVSPGRVGALRSRALASASLASDFVPAGVLPEGDGPSAAVFTTDGAKLVVAHRDSKNLIVFDAATQAFVLEVALSGSPADVAVSPDGVHALTANVWEDTVSIVDLSAGVEVTTVPVGDQPGIVRVTPNGVLAVAGNTVSQSVSVIDVASATELWRILGAGFVGSVAVAFEPGVIAPRFGGLEVLDDLTAIHADFLNDQIDLYHLATGTLTSLASNADPRGVAVTPDGKTAVVAHTGSVRRLTVVDGVAQSIAKTISTTVDLSGPVSVRPDGSRAVAAVQNACVVVDIATSAVSSQLNTASVEQLLTTADGGFALAVGFKGALISYAAQSVVAELNNIVSTSIGAVSPAGPRGALIADLFGEDMLVVNTSGAAGFLEAHVMSGPLPEADRTRMVAIDPKGVTAVATNVLSDNASVVYLPTGAVLGVVPVGDRPAEVEITPDGKLAVVANLDSPFVSVIDLASLSSTSVPTSTRNSEVEISPDGSYAYVAVVVSDGVWRVDLSTLSVAGPKLVTGQMGSVGFLYQQSSGIALSHDGGTLVTCNSFDDTLTVIDTATWSVVKTVAVGDFPVRAVFSADDSTIYVSNKTAGTVSVVANAGAGSVQTGLVNVGSQPFELALSPSGARLYVANAGDDTVGVVDLALASMIAAVPVPNDPQGLHATADGTRLYAASGTWSVSIGPGPLTVVAKAGAFTEIDTASLAPVAQVATGLPPAMLAFDPCDTVGLAAAPFADGLARAEVGAQAAVTPYGCGINPAGSLTVLSGTPAIGGTVTLGLDNPLGTQAPGSFAALALTLAPDPAFPCGTLIPGFGMPGPGASGELLVLLGGPASTILLAGPPWAGPGVPASIAIGIPGNCKLVGAPVYAQGAIVDPTISSGVGIGLTGAIELLLGL